MITCLLGWGLYEEAIDVIITRYYLQLLHFHKHCLEPDFLVFCSEAMLLTLGCLGSGTEADNEQSAPVGEEWSIRSGFKMLERLQLSDLNS